MKLFFRKKYFYVFLCSVESKLKPWAFNLTVGGPYNVTMPNGGNIRKSIADIIHNVQQKILEVDEGDTKSVKNIITVGYKKQSHCSLFTYSFSLDLQHNFV